MKINYSKAFIILAGVTLLVVFVDAYRGMSFGWTSLRVANLLVSLGLNITFLLLSKHYKTTAG